VASGHSPGISCASRVKRCGCRTDYFFFAGAEAAIIGATPLNMSPT
jgi:hypothetical protein